MPAAGRPAVLLDHEPIDTLPQNPGTDAVPASILAQCPGQRILVVGDVMLDEYLWGTVQRLSPEAPVPVVEEQHRSHVPGGAANAAANVAGLGAEAILLGVVGSDTAADNLRAALGQQGVGIAGLLVDPNRPTTTKTRIVAQNQQVVRIDREERSPLPEDLQERLLHLVEEHLPGVSGCLVSDYAEGVVSAGLARQVIHRCAARGKAVVVDPKGTDARKYRGATVVKPNRHEAALLLRRAVSSQEVLAAGKRLVEMLEATAVLLTCGAAGMTLFARGKEPAAIPALAREVFDVTGAGDTVAATLAVTLAAGAGLEQAARLASQAAAIIVGRVGTTAVRLAELLAQRAA